MFHELLDQLTDVEVVIGYTYPLPKHNRCGQTAPKAHSYSLPLLNIAFLIVTKNNKTIYIL